MKFAHRWARAAWARSIALATRALNREVAIKVLPESFASIPSVCAVSSRKPRPLRRSTTPTFLPSTSSATFEGAPYMVSELLDGETLRAATAARPAAASQGHRLRACRSRTDWRQRTTRASFIATSSRRTSSSPKTAASRFSTSAGQADPAQSRLRRQRSHASRCRTDPGMVMGTAGYMSPEQVRGQTVDHRTDIFAFGAILYEMLTGKRAFQRSTSAETMTAILNDDPPAISQTGANIPPALQRVVHRCLEKNPEQRFHSASRSGLRARGAIGFGRIAGSSHAGAVSPFAGKNARVVDRPDCGDFAGGRGLVRDRKPERGRSAANLGVYPAHPQRPCGICRRNRWQQALPDTAWWFSIDEVAVSGGEIETVPSITLPNPFLVDVSPDGSTLLVQSFRAETPSLPLYTVQVVGGAHRYLADATIAGGTWSPDGKLVAYSTPNGDINVINSDGTGAHKLASVGGAAFPLSWSPDGSTIRFSRDLRSLWEITSSGSNLHQLLPGWHPSEQKCCGRWSPDGGFFVFLAGPLGPGTYPEAQIYALDERRGLFRRPANEPVQLTFGPIEWSPPVFSKDGKKIFATGSTRRGELVRLDPKSNQFQPFLGGISADLVAFSKDGQSVAYVTYPDGILWRANRDGSDRVQLTSPPLQPQIGRLVTGRHPDRVHGTVSARYRQAWIVPSTGGSPQRLLPEDSGQETDPNWSPDGRKIDLLPRAMLGSRESHIRILDLASHQISTLPGSDGKFSPHWSPDGQFINADSLDVSTIYVFDIKTQHWSALYTKASTPMRGGRAIAALSTS